MGDKMNESEELFNKYAKNEVLSMFHEKLKEANLKVSANMEKDFLDYLYDDFWQWVDDNIDNWIKDRSE